MRADLPTGLRLSNKWPNGSLSLVLKYLPLSLMSLALSLLFLLSALPRAGVYGGEQRLRSVRRLALGGGKCHIVG